MAPAPASRQKISPDSPPELPLSAQGAEKRSHILDQALRLFGWRKMAARGHDRPTLQVIVALRPFARHQHHFLQEDGHSRRRLDHGLAVVRWLPLIVRSLVVIARRSAEALGHPVNR